MSGTQLDEQTVTAHPELEGIGPVPTRVLVRGRKRVRGGNRAEVENRLHGRGSTGAAYLSEGRTTGGHRVTFARARRVRCRINQTPARADGRWDHERGKARPMHVNIDVSEVLR